MPERPSPPDARPLIRAGAEFLGLLVLHGDARIDGHVEGEIVGARSLEVGVEGRVEACIEADEVVVAGAVRGDVVGRQRIELRSTARVCGAIETPSLVVDEGGVFDGPCRIVKAGEPG